MDNNSKHGLAGVIEIACGVIATIAGGTMVCRGRKNYDKSQQK